MGRSEDEEKLVEQQVKRDENYYWYSNLTGWKESESLPQGDEYWICGSARSRGMMGRLDWQYSCSVFPTFMLDSTTAYWKIGYATAIDLKVLVEKEDYADTRPYTVQVMVVRRKNISHLSSLFKELESSEFGFQANRLMNPKYFDTYYQESKEFPEMSTGLTFQFKDKLYIPEVEQKTTLIWGKFNDVKDWDIRNGIYVLVTAINGMGYDLTTKLIHSCSMIVNHNRIED